MVEMCDLFDSNKSKDKINDLLAKYHIEARACVSPMNQAYQEISGEYSSIVCFISAMYDINVVEVMCSIGNGVFWSRSVISQWAK